ncbi:MAG: hypothetical protein KJ060_00005 [Candidatus Hydrogenedentes bacterium]|nr:hypothetical protein [Candidatus Hydrogenedentota bacterium]
MNQNASNRERVITLCIGMFYLWAALGAGHSVTTGALATAYITVACWLIWYPVQISRIPLRFRRFRLPYRIAPLYIRFAGWVLLLFPLWVVLLGPLFMSKDTVSG